MRPHATAIGLLAFAVLAAAAGVCCDWTRRQLRRIRLRSLVFDHTDLGIIVADPNATIIAANRAYCTLSGYAEDELVGQNPRLQQSGRHDREFYRDLWTTLQSTGQWQGEIWNRRKSGVAYPAWQNISAVRDKQGGIAHYVAIVSDITPVKAVQDRLAHLAHHDPVTDLPNRLYFIAALERALAQAQRHATTGALLFVDLDRFKAVNDAFGHAAGDRLLFEVAQRLRHAVRAGDLVARFAGDEFVVLLEQVRDADEAALVARKILADLTGPMAIGSHTLTPSASIGIAMFPLDGISAASLVDAADAAMYEAKHRGRGGVAFRPAAAGRAD